MVRFSVVFLFGLIAACSSSTVSYADLVLDLRYTDLTTSKTVSSGSSVFVDLLITDTDASTSLVAEGLVTGGGRLMQTAGAINLVAGVITGNPGWIQSFDTNPASAGGANEIAKVLGATDLFFGPAVFPAGSSVVIATFQLIATGAPGSIATITSDLLGPGLSSNFTFTSFEDLDANPALTFGSVDLTLSGAAAVPEPATVVLGSISLCAAGAAAWRKRRRRLRQSSQSVA